MALFGAAAGRASQTVAKDVEPWAVLILEGE
jgi:hypothetical protein